MRTSKYGESNAYVLDDPTLSWKPCQGDSSNLSIPDHRKLKIKTSAALIFNIFLKDYQDKDGQRRLLESFQYDIKYEHVGPKTQDRKKAKYYKDDQVMIKDLKGNVKR
ncbi:hypothetical protein Tco_0828109 [Tanacetum coccineum]